VKFESLKNEFEKNFKKEEILFSSPLSLSLLAHCRMDLPEPTTSVGTRTDYSVGP
jgi:hypothetical protein